MRFLYGVQTTGHGHLVRSTPITRQVMDWFAPASIPGGAHWDSFGAPVLPPTVDPEVRNLARAPVETDLVLVYLGFEPLDRLVQLLR